MIRILKEETGNRDYDNTGALVLYVKEKDFATEWGKKQLERIEEQGVWIDRKVLNSRGIDYDIWHDFYLDDEARDAFDNAKGLW